MWVRVKGRPGNRITGSAHTRIASRLACPTRSENWSSVDLPGLPASRNPHGFGHSECGAWCAVMPFSLVILAGCDGTERRLVGSGPTKRRAVPSAPGVGRTRHPKLGAAEQPSVAVLEPSRNQWLTKFRALYSAARVLSVNSVKIKERQEKILALLSARPFCLFCNFFLPCFAETNDLKPSEIRAAFFVL